MIRQAVILAGGKGTRIRELVGDMPKPMLQVGGKSLLEHQILLGRRHGFTRFFILVAHNPQSIIDYFGDGSRWGVEVTYRHEVSPLGTGGALADAWDLLEDRFMVFYGDTLVNVDLDRMWQTHEDRKAAVTMFLHPNDHPSDSDLVELDADGWVRTVHPYPHPEGAWLPNLVNAALYVVNRRVLQPWRGTGIKADFAKNMLPQMTQQGERILGYRSPEYIKDVGTVRRHQEVSRDYVSGRIERGTLVTPKSAIFLDRDGTLVEDVNGLTDPEQLVLFEKVPDAIREINESEYYSVLITNQPVIAKGQCSVEQLKEIHNKLETCLGVKGAYLNGIYYCPHHPDKGFPGERPELKIPCECRKPGIGLVRQAATELNIHLPSSWMIGDSTCDMETARRAGVQSVLVRTGYRGEDKKYRARPDYEFFDLAEAVRFIIHDYSGILEKCEEWMRTIKAGDRIVIGGLARSGKSVLSQVFRHALLARGMAATIVSLDAWIVGLDKRQAESTVRDRFDYEAIRQFWKRLACNAADAGVMPCYNRYSGISGHDQELFKVNPGEILIVEGVPALDIPELVGEANVRIYVEMNEVRRKELFFREYLLRGRSLDEVEALYMNRMTEEYPVIARGRHVADVIWENPA